MAKKLAPAPSSPPPGGPVVHSHEVTISEPSAVDMSMPLLPANSAYILLVDPRDWQVLGGQVLPDLRQFDLLPGLNNVTIITTIEAGGHKRERVSWKKALDDVRRLGMIPLDYELAPNGRTYLGKCQVAGGWHHHLQWTTPHVGTDQVTTDLDGYVAWLRSLVDKGVIPAPQPWVLARLRTKLSKLLYRATDRAQKNPALQSKAIRLAEHVAVVDAEIARRKGSAPVAASVEVAPVSLTDPQ